MKKGFSMMEVLVALALGGLLLVSSTDLLVSISKRWIDGPSSKDAFDAHVNGVSRFLTAVMEEATVPTLNSSGNQAIDLRRPVGFSDSEDPLIHFYLRDAPPFFVWPKGPAQRVHAYLYFEEGEGLSIAWFSELQELEKNEEGEMAPEDEDELFKTLVSPFCEAIHYCYYGDEDDGELDIKEWEYPTDLRESEKTEGKFQLPAFIKLVFRGEEEGLDRTITIPIERLSPNGLEEESQ